jgi:hypothetical protein
VPGVDPADRPHEPGRLRRLAEGLHRLPKEHYSVIAIRPATGEARRVPTEWWRYYADPFLLRREGRAWAFFEDFRYLERRGRIGVVEVLDDLTTSPPLTALEEPHHLSYPFLWEERGRLFMLPESHHARTLDLYECVEFPTRWTLRRRLFDGIDAVDSTLLRHEGRTWLFTSVRAAGSMNARHLAILSTEDLLEGPLEAHPVNEGALYLDQPETSGRGAGPFLRDEAGWLRPAQHNREFYGEGLRLLRIKRLDRREFEEEPFTGDHFAAEAAARFGSHHVSGDASLLLVDARDRFSYLQYVPGLGHRGRPRTRPPGSAR